MKSWFFSLIALLLLVPPVFGHFVYILPQMDGNTGRVVFSDRLAPDDAVNVELIKGTKLFIVERGGQTKTLTMTRAKDKPYFTVEVPGNGTRIVAGKTNYGVFQRGDNPPFWLAYYPKAIFGDLPFRSTPVLTGVSPVEIVPVVRDGQLHFQAYRDRKPLPGAEFRITIPGKTESITLTADDVGLTKGFSTAGMYGAQTVARADQAGELDGKKYEEVRNYATLVLTFKP